MDNCITISEKKKKDLYFTKMNLHDLKDLNVKHFLKLYYKIPWENFSKSGGEGVSF